MPPHRALLGILLALFWTSKSGALTVSRIAFEGDSAPGLTGQVFTGFSAPVINEAGAVAMTGNVSGPISSWLFSKQPAGSLIRYGEFGPNAKQMGSDGSVYFRTSASSQLQRGRPGGATTVIPGAIAAGDFAPGANFVALAGTQAAIEGVWTYEPVGNTIQPVVEVGDPAPNSGGRSFVDLFNFQLQLANPNGNTVLFHADLTGGLSSFWTSGGSGLQRIALEGDAAPGTAAGITFSNINFSGNALASNGDVTFVAALTGPGVTAVNDVGVYTSREGILDLVIRGGDPLPGVSRTLRQPIETRMTASGRVTLEAEFHNLAQTNSAGVGLWRTDAAGVLQRIASENGVVPGLPSTIRYGGTYELFQNNAGWLLFENSLVGAPNGTQETLFLVSPEDELQILLRAGELFAAGPGLDFVISNIAVGGLTNSGLIVVDLAFTNGLEGVYVLDLELPDAAEPALAALAPGALGVLALRRRRRV